MQEKYKGIILFGPPLAGKGVSGCAINCMPGYHHISTGKIFRELDTQSELGKKVGETINQGRLVEDDVLFDILQSYLKENMENKEDYVVFDGVPRTVNQVSLLEEISIIEKIFYIKASEDVLIARSEKRALEEGRADDQNIEIVKERIKTYNTKTKKILELYDQNIIHEIDNSGRRIERFFEDIFKAL